jgi:hypothetical protein
MGAQAALVALPYQLYVVTHSALLVGLLGAVELGPLIAMALLSFCPEAIYRCSPKSGRESEPLCARPDHETNLADT